MKKIYKTSLYILYLLVVSGIAIEVIGGLFLVSDGTHLCLKREQLFVSDDTLGYRLRPGFNIAASDNRLYPGVSIVIGSHGLRSPEFDGRSKIILVGDSVTFGYGIKSENTIAAQLERRLDGRYQVINAGVPGYNFTQWQSMGEALAADTHPKAVVAVVNANDFQARYYPIMGGATVAQYRSLPWDTQLPEDPGTAETRTHSLLGWLFGNLSKGLSLTRIAKTPPHDANTTVELYEAELRQIQYYNSAAPEVRERFAQAQQGMTQFADRITAGGADVVFAFLPYRVTAMQSAVGADQRFEALADAVQVGPRVGVVRLTKVLYEDRDFIPGDSHTSAVGNRLIADALAEKISAMMR